LSACGGGTTPPPPAPEEKAPEAASDTTNAPAPSDVQLRVQVAGQPLNIMPLEFVKRFQDETGIEAIVEETIYAEIETKTQTGFISNTLQDVVYGHHRWLFINFLKGIYMPLDDFFASNPPPEFEDIYPSIMAGNMLDGKNFSLPETVHAGGNIAVSYNKAILTEKGLDEPKEGWNFKDRTELARAAADPDAGIFGLGLDDFTALHYYSNVSRAWGSPESTDCWVMDAEGKKLQIDKPVHAEIAAWYTGLINDRVVPKKADYIEDAASNLFIAGKTATHASIAGNVATFLDQIAGKFEMDAVVLPIGPDGRIGSCYSGNQYMVNAQSEHPEEAYELVKLFTSKEAGIYSVLEAKLQPNGHKSAWTDPDVNKVNSVYGKVDGFLSKGVEPFPMPANTRFTEANDAYRNEIALVWEGDTTWEEHMPVIMEKVQKVLDLDRPS
jgi:ABC-type glycerol-3-phosphate transport system substrate-binding protein